METYDVKPTVLIFAHIWNFRNRKEKWAESNDFLVIEVSSQEPIMGVMPRGLARLSCRMGDDVRYSTSGCRSSGSNLTQSWRGTKFCRLGQAYWHSWWNPRLQTSEDSRAILTVHCHSKDTSIVSILPRYPRDTRTVSIFPRYSRDTRTVSICPR